MFKALLIILLSGSTFTRTQGATSAEIKAAFEEHKVIPDALDTAPTDLLGVEFPSKDGLVANLGHLVPPLLLEIAFTVGSPRITWKNSKTDKFYFVIMTDLDIPIWQRDPPPPPYILLGRLQFLHWMVWNIPGGNGFNVSHGHVFREYLFPGPPQDDIHRYTFLVFEQPSELTFEEDNVGAVANRTINEWAQKYKMGNPVAGNFIRVEGIPFVPPDQRPPVDYTPTFSPTEPTQPEDITRSSGPSSINLPVASLLSLAYIPLAICCIFCHSLRF